MSSSGFSGEYIAQRNVKFGGRQAWEPDLRRKVVFGAVVEQAAIVIEAVEQTLMSKFSNVTHFLEWCENVTHFLEWCEDADCKRERFWPRDSERCPIAAYIRHCLAGHAAVNVSKGVARLVVMTEGPEMEPMSWEMNISNVPWIALFIEAYDRDESGPRPSHKPATRDDMYRGWRAVADWSEYQAEARHVGKVQA